MHPNRPNSSTSDQVAARVFEAWLKRHAHENSGCQWELDWFAGSLKETVQRSRAQIIQEVKKLAESGQSPCNKFMQELTKPYLDAARTVGLRLSASQLSLRRDGRPLAGGSSPGAWSPGTWSPGAWSSASDASSRPNTPVAPGDTRKEEPAKTSVNAPPVGAGPSTVAFPNVNDLQTRANTRRLVESPLPGSKPPPQEVVTPPPRPQPEHANEPQNEALTPLQINLGDPPSRGPGARLDLDDALKSEDVPSQTQPKDEPVIPSFNLTPAVEQIPEPQWPGHDTRPTEPAPTTPLIQIEFYDPPEPGPAEHGSKDAETDVQDSVFGEVSPRNMVVVDQPEPAKKPEQVLSRIKTELLVERVVPKFDQTSSSDYPQIEAENIPIQQPELQLDTLPKPDQVTPQAQPTDELPPSLERAPAPSQTVEPQLQSEPKYHQAERDKTDERWGTVGSSEYGQPAASPPATGKPLVQEVTAPSTLRPGHVDEAEAPSQVKLEDSPSQEPELRPDLGGPPVFGQAPSQTWPKDEDVAPSSKPAPGIEQIPGPQQLGQEDQPTGPALVAPQPGLELYDPCELALGAQESRDVETGTRDLVLDEVSPGEMVVVPGLESSSAVEEMAHQPEPAKEPERVPSGTKTEPKQPVPQLDQASSSGHPRIETKNRPIQPEPQPEPPEIPPADKPPSNSELTPSPSQTVEPQRQGKSNYQRAGEGKTKEQLGTIGTAHDSEHGQSAAPGHDPSPEAPWRGPEVPDLREAGPKLDSVAEVGLVRGAIVVPPAPEGTNTAQEATRQLEPAEEPERIAHEIEPESSLGVQLTLAPVPGESLPPPPVVGSIDSGHSPSPQPTHVVPTAHTAPDAESQPSPVQAPGEVNPTQESPSPTPEAHPDLPGTVVGEMQQAVADRDGNLAASLSSVDLPEIQPDSKLPSPEPVKPGLPGQGAPPAAEADATTTDRASAASGPSVQDVTTPETLQPGLTNKPLDEAQAPPQVKLENLPDREPQIRLGLGAPLKSEDIPPQTQLELEAHAPCEPAPVEQESQGVATGEGPVLDEVSLEDVVITPGPESPPAVQETVLQPEPAKESEQASSGTKTEPIAEPEELVPKIDQAPSSDPSRTESQNISVQQPQAPVEHVPAPVFGTEPAPDVDADQASPTNLDSSPPEPAKSSPAPEPASDQVPPKIPAGTLQVHIEPDSSPFALISGSRTFDIRSRAVGEGDQFGGPVALESQGDDEPLGPDVAPESNGSTLNPPEVGEADGAGEIRPDDKPLENVSPPVVLESVVVPEDTRPEEPTKTSAEVNASSGIVTFPKSDDMQTPEAGATTTNRAPDASKPSIQDIMAPEAEHADKPQDEAQAPPQFTLEDLPGREPEVDHGAPLKSEDVQTQPELETLALREPAPVEQESQGVTTDGQGPVLDQVSLGDAVVVPGPESSPAVQETALQPKPVKEPEQASSETKTEPTAEPEELVPKIDQAPNSDPSRTESQNVSVQRLGPQLELPEAQPINEPLSSSGRTPTLNQAVESQLRETAGDSEHGQPAALGHDSSPKVPQSNPGLPDPREAVPRIGSASEVPVQESAIVPPAPESTNIAQEIARQPGLAEEPEQISSTVGAEPLLDVQPSLPAPAPVPSKSLPPPPAAESVDLGPRPSPQPVDAGHIAPGAEPQPSAAQVPIETGPTQEPPSPMPEAHPDLSSTLVGETQQVVADQDGSLAADSSPAGHFDMQPDVELTDLKPVKPGPPGKGATPATDPEINHPVSTPVPASTAGDESAYSPLDTLGPQPRAQAESPIPPDDPGLPLDPTAAEASRLCKEASRLAQQFGSYGNVDDLDGAIEAYGQAAELLAPGPDSLAVTGYLNLGRMMRIKFEAFNDIEDLDSAFDDGLLKAHELLRSTPKDELYRDILHELGAAYLGRYLYDGTNAAGDDAHRYCELALNAQSSPSGPKRAGTLCVLSRLHLARFEYFSRTEDAVSALESLDTSSEADPTLNGEARYLENRARALFACYQTRRPEYTGFLDEALGLARQARDLTPPVAIQHPIASTFLADLLLARYERSHGQPDLEEALELLERAVRQVPYVRPEQPWVGERLARALIERFVNQGAREDLNDAISFLEIALNLTVTNAYRRQARLDAFGGALTLRFRYLALGEVAEGDRRQLMAGIGSM